MADSGMEQGGADIWVRLEEGRQPAPFQEYADYLLGVGDIFTAPESPLFWGSLLVCISVAFASAAWQRNTRPLQALQDTRRALFSRHIWWHRSSRADIAFTLVNGVLFPLLFIGMLVPAYEVQQGVVGLLETLAGSRSAGSANWWGLALHAVLLFLAQDWGRFLGHYALHKVPLLWEFHRVHHSAQVLTPLTQNRLHPVDLLLLSGSAALFSGLEAGFAAYFLGVPMGATQFTGWSIGAILIALGGSLGHTHAWVSYGSVLNRLLMAPALHQIHHSTAPQHWDKNLGFSLSVWDQLFGTYHAIDKPVRLEFGIGDGTDASYHGLLQLYIRPLLRLSRRGDS